MYVRDNADNDGPPLVGDSKIHAPIHKNLEV